MAGGDCFLVAASLMQALDHHPATRLAEIHLCHGVPLGTGGEAKDLRYDHAWVEMDDSVLEFSNGNHAVVRRETYYAVGQIDPEQVRRYTPNEAAVLMLTTGHYGPWNEDGDE